MHPEYKYICVEELEKGFLHNMSPFTHVGNEWKLISTEAGSHTFWYHLRSGLEGERKRHWRLTWVERHGWLRAELMGWLVIMCLEGKQTDAHEYFAAIQKPDWDAGYLSPVVQLVSVEPSHAFRAWLLVWWEPSMILTLQKNLTTFYQMSSQCSWQHKQCAVRNGKNIRSGHFEEKRLR